MLRSGLEQPDPRKLAGIVLRDFGIPEDFAVFIDGTRVTSDAIEGKRVEVQLKLSDGSEAQGTMWLLPSQRAVADPGVVLQVDDRTIGGARRFGLDEDPDLPQGAWRRMYIEIKDNGLRADITADQTDVIENSRRLREIQEATVTFAKEQYLILQEDDADETEQEFIDRWQKQEQLEMLPFTQRERTLQGLRRVFTRLFEENRDRRDIVANLVIDIFRQEPYWLIARRLDEIQPRDLVALSNVLSEWGLGNMAELSARAMIRLKFLDQFTKLILLPSTGEFKGVHPVLKNNPWLLGDEYEVMVSNQQINTIVKSTLDRLYRGQGGKDRPDLILTGPNNKLLLVELKSPQDTFDWDNESQAKRYRDRLAPFFPGKTFTVFVLAGKAPPDMVRNADPSIRLFTYAELATEAEARLRWLIENIDVSPLQSPPSQPDFGI